MIRPKPSIRKRRKAAYWRGIYAEWLAALWLVMKGYQLLAWRTRTPLGEIDLIARKSRLIIFVEVKTRPTPDKAIEALTLHATERIQRASMVWMSQHKHFADYDQRFDLITISYRTLPQHIKDAWRPH